MAVGDDEAFIVVVIGYGSLEVVVEDVAARED